MYRIVDLVDPRTGAVLHVAREKESSKQSYVLSNTVSGARRGEPGYRYDVTRELLIEGKRPVRVVVQRGLSKSEAASLADSRRVKHGVVLYKRLSPYKRIHQQTDPDSPYLDKAKVYYVYELVRPDTGMAFYVGKGSDRHPPRINDHIRKAKAGNRGHKFSVIRKLLKAGLRPIERRVGEKLTESDALKLEVEHIDSIGLKVLTNDAPGGQTAPTGDDHWTRKHPEKVLRGEDHPWNKNPELGRKNVNAMQAALKADPSKRPRGAKHGMSKLSRAQVERIRARYQKGLDSGKRVTGRRLAADYKVTPTQISRVLRGESWDLPSLIKKHGNAKLTKVEIASIPARLAAGRNQKQVAEELGVSHSLVNYYVKLVKCN